MKKIWIFRMVAICVALAVALGITALPSHLRATGAEAMAETAAGDVPVAEPATESPAPEPAAETPAPEPAVQSEPEPVSAEPTAAPATATPAPPSNDEAVPTPTSAPTPSPAPTQTSSAEPSATASAAPSASASAAPSASTSTDPSASASPDPSASASPDPSASASPSPSAGLIAAFAPLDPSSGTLPEKPALEQMLAVLPTALDAALQDGTVVTVAVTWSCPDFDAEKAEYVFTASLADPAYALAEGVSMPSFLLRIESEQMVYGDFVFDKNDDGTLTLSGYTGSGSSVSVPAQVDGMAVAAIARSAFSGNRSLVEVVVPDGVLRLEGGAFASCASLKKVRLPDSLEEVGGGLFDGCGALEDLQLDISIEAVMTGPRGYTREVVLENNEVKTIRIEIDRDFTDYSVLSGGLWRVEGALRIDAEHAASVASGGTLRISSAGSIVVNGSLSCSGSAANEGRVVACGGSVSGVGGDVVLEHSFENGVCTVCGAQEEPAAKIPLTLSLVAGSIEKTYDGTSGLDLGADDFAIEGVESGDEVYIAVINTDFNESNAGNYLASASFELGGADAAKYEAKPMELNIVIHKCPVTVTPRSGQSKVYGESDPSIRATYRGTVSGETLSGRLSRESGESVGRYRITMGTLESSNPNYAITLASETFEITPKSISDASVTVARIPNQRYTGAALTPSAEVRDGGRTLAQGADYTLSYESNVEVGSGVAIISGTGNYTGTRTASFRVIRVSSSGGGGVASIGAFAGVGTEYVSPEDVAAATTSTRLVLGETDFGEVLFDADGAALSFSVGTRTAMTAEGTERHYLCIAAAEKTDQLGLIVPGEYGEPRLKLSMDVLSAIAAMGYTDIELTVGEAQARIPLDTLYAEYADETGTLAVASYEFRLWPIRTDALQDYESRALEGYAPVLDPYHFELLALPASGAEEGAESVGEDVLSLLTGVQLLFAPEQAPDYLNVPYSFVSAEAADPEVVPAPQGAAFIMENDVVKSVLTPLYGGMYALATAQAG